MADREPVTLRVQGFPAEMVGNPITIEEGWLPFFISADYPFRMIAATTHFDLRCPVDVTRDQLRIVDIQRRTVDHLRAMVNEGNGHVPAAALAAYLDTLGGAAQGWIDAALGDGDVQLKATWEAALTILNRAAWRRRWLLAYEGYFERLNTHLALRGLRHHMVAWLDEGMRPGDFAQQVGRAFHTSATVDVLPNLLQVPYVERYRWKEAGCYLEPEEPDQPLCVMLTLAGPLRGQWDTTVLHRLLHSGDVAVCVDVQPVSRTRMEYEADQTITSRTWQFRRSSGPRDARAEREYAAAHRMQEDLATEAAHDLRLVVAVFGDDLDSLNQQVRLVSSAAGTRVPLMRVPGQQVALSRFFTTEPTKRIEVQARTHRMLSHGVAVTTMFGLRKPDRTDGILWLFQGDTPIFFHPIRDRRAGHAVVLGKTGSGKTFALNVWMMRWLAQGHQVVLYEPQGHSERFIRACGSGGARFVLNLDQQLNILDVIATRGERNEPPSLGVQVAHVVTQLSVLLGGSAMTAEGREQFYPRIWESTERGVLEIALQQLYAPWADNLDALSVERTPILADLVVALRAVGRQLQAIEVQEMAGVSGDTGGDRRRRRRSHDAFDLAGEVELRLIMGPYGKNFNARTSVDWDFSHDATAYDFSQIPEGPVRIFYYAQAFGALNRAVRAPNRDRSRPLWAVIDEFKYMASVPSLATFAANAVKTWRTFGAALWTADQDAHTYLGTEGATPDPAMLSVWLNSTMKMILRQDQADAARIAEKIQGMQPSHADMITRLTRGDIVLVWESDDDQMTYNEVFVGRVGVDDMELRAFRGS